MDKRKENKSTSNVVQIEPDGIELKSGLLLISFSMNLNVCDVQIHMN